MIGGQRIAVLPGDTKLCPEAADAIMTAVRDRIASAGFHARSESFVSVMDGADEGAHGWVSVNYLLGNLGGRPEKTVSVVDLGGGSTQIAYAVGSRAAKEAPDGYVRTIQATSSKYSTYVHGTDASAAWDPITRESAGAFVLQPQSPSLYVPNCVQVSS